MKISNKPGFFTISNIIRLILPIAIISIMTPFPSQAKLLRVTATGTIDEIFGFTSASPPPFAVGDPFAYEVIVDDDPNLDTNPYPEYTRHRYTPNFMERVAGAAMVKFGAYTIPATDVKTTTLFVVNEEYNETYDSPFDSIEITSRIGSLPCPGFSLHQTDLSGLALSGASITPEAFLGFMSADTNHVYLFMDYVAGACAERKCAYGRIGNISVTVSSSPVFLFPLLLE
jgi:hypothetical protein